MKKIICIFLIFIVIISLVVMWRIAFPSGYYSSPEIAIEKEKKSLDSEVIASFENGQEVMKVLRNGTDIIFYDFVSRKTMNGIKYGTSQDAKISVDYDKVTQTCPDYKDWNLIQLVLERKQGRDMHNVSFTIVENSDGLYLDSDVMKFEYNYNQKQYLLLVRIMLD